MRQPVSDVDEWKAQPVGCHRWPIVWQHTAAAGFTLLCFASQLWSIFRAIVGGTLTSLGRQLDCTVEAIMSAIDTRVEEFFVSSLQLDVLTMELEHE